MDYKIFISYRRSDSADATGRLFDRLETVYTRSRLFIDVDSIAKGEDFVEVMTEKVAESAVVLPVIGPDWLNAKDETGRRRLDDSGDPVRIELEKALSTGKIIIPVLVRGASMPGAQDLPDSLKPLARRNAETLSHATFATDVKRLAAAMDAAAARTEARALLEAERRRAEELDARRSAAADATIDEVAKHAALAGMHSNAPANPRASQMSGNSVSRRRLVLGGGALAATAGLGAIFWDDLGLPPMEVPKPAPEPAAPIATPGKQIMRLDGHEGTVSSAAFSPNGTHVVTGSIDKTARIWDAATGKQIMRLEGHDNLVLSSAFSPDGRHVVTGSADGTARIWDAATGKEIMRLDGHNSYVSSAAFSPDGLRVVTGSVDKTARILDAATGKEIMRLSGHDSNVISAAFSPDGLRVVTGSVDNTARLWDAATGMEIVRLEGHGDTVASAAFSPDGRRVVTGSRDNTARIWDAVTGREIMRLDGHDSYVTSAAFSPDGRRVVTGSWDNTARIWDAATGKQIMRLEGHESAVTSTAFSPDGLRVVTGSDDNTARIWDVAGV